jgi:DNA-binding NarL/FixJ family response regulator
MDLLMPEMDDIAATQVLRQELPDTQVVALTSVLEDQAIFDAIRVGAISYLLKDTEADKWCEAIRHSHSSYLFQPPVPGLLRPAEA